MEKQKIFVRYFPGAGGLFVAMLCRTLLGDEITWTDTKSGHQVNEILGNGSNLHEHIFHPDSGYYLREDADLYESTQWVKQTFNFFTTTYPHYSIITHCINPYPLLHAFENSKLISIKCEHDDINQLAYNWIEKIKDYSTESDYYSIINGKLENAKLLNPLLSLPNSIDDIRHDVRMLTYIFKLGTTPHFKHMNQFNLTVCSVYEIRFRDLMTGRFKNQVGELAQFLGMSDYRYIELAVDMIEKYAFSQVTIPFDLP